MPPGKNKVERRCIGCRERHPQREMLRIVRNPQGKAIFDLDARLPGRGAWVCPAAACLRRLRGGSLGHHLRGIVDLPAYSTLRDRLGERIEAKCRDLLTIGAKSGQTVLGWHAVRETLLRSEAALLLGASDASSRTLHAMRSLACDLPVRKLADRRRLGHWLGRDSLAAIAVKDVHLAQRLLTLLDRLTAIEYSPYHSGTAITTRGD